MVARTISPLISRSISRAINELEGAAFNPIALFAAGEQGVWYDPSDLSTLFQDAAGTIPVTAAGQPVGMMRDKSGRGNHATQATATSRPILQTTDGKWYLAIDGVDDWMATTAINFTATNKVTLWAGIRKNSDAAPGVLYELSATIASNNGSFALLAPPSATPSYSVGSRGTATVSESRQPFASPHLSVLCAQSDIAAPALSLRVNTSPGGVGSGSHGTGNYGNYPLYIGRRGGASVPFNGRIYSLIIRGAASTAQQVTDTENYINSKTGAY